MVTKAINTSDLLNLKLEISEEQRKIRHDANWKLQEDYYKIDAKISEHKSDLRLTNQVMDRMQKDIVEIKDMLIDFIKTTPTMYATKEEDRDNKREIENIKSTGVRLIWALWWTFWSFIIWFFLFILKKFWIL